MLKIPNTMISIEAHSMNYDRNSKTVPYNSVLISVYLYAHCHVKHRTTFVHLLCYNMNVCTPTNAIHS